ncbi:hypothetical protein MAM1_0247c08684 [Mucor ambiguus]|uniref:Uncharacterized protein n=1 Tax=Mucor ambiguus TaxID=91626 RepID=A0A0C9MZR5_9FUNG|nr:hypothetical protein MAM1_0247c08684 [Mucor ambiguus]
MEHKSKFYECKRRNELKITDIKSLESRIRQARAQIEAKRNSLNELRQKQAQYRCAQPAQPQHQPTANRSGGSNPSILLGRRRDLTQLLPTTPDMICKKLEFYIKRQFETQKFISEAEINQVKHLIDRLPEKHDKQQTHRMVNALLRQVESMQKPEDYAFHIREAKEYRDIQTSASKQKQEIGQLIKRKDELELKIRESESILIQRIRQVHVDPVVQSAVAKNIRIKAAAQQVDVELQSLMNQADALVENISSSKEFQVPANKEAIMKDYETRIVSIGEHHYLECRLSEWVQAKAVETLRSLIHANEIGNSAIRDNRVQVKDENREKIEQILDGIKKEKVRLQLERLQPFKPSNKTTAIPSDDHALEDAAIIKSTLSPNTSISLGEALSKVVNILESVNYLSKESVENVCTDIRETLDRLVKKWESSLHKQHIPIAQDIPEVHDGIDNVIQSVDALRGNMTMVFWANQFSQKRSLDHLEHTELRYIEEQKAKLKEKMDMAECIEAEMKTAQEYLHERSLISQVGKEYEIDGKNFKEWLERLQVDPENKQAQ